MEIKKEIFLSAEQGKQIEYIWDKLDEVCVYIKEEKKKRHAISAITGFIGGCFTVVMFQFKLFWESMVGK